MIVSLIVLQILSIIVLLIVLFVLSFWVLSSLGSRVPFIGVPMKVLSDIEKALDIKDGSVVYDLGSGDMRVLRFLSTKYPKAEFIGIEKSSFPYHLSRFLLYIFRKNYPKNIKVIKADFFKYDLSRATHVFTYLYPQVMDDLLPKLDRELATNESILVSASFKFTQKQPEKEIDLNRSKNSLVRTLFVYKF